MALTQVKSDGIATGAVTATQIAANAVTVDDISDGSISTAKLADSAVTNAKVDASAAIAGTKISPNFGSQNIVTTGTATVSGDLAVNTNTLFVDASADHVGINTTATPSGQINLTVDRTSGPGSIQLAHSNTGGGAIVPASAGGLEFYTYTGAIGSESYSERFRLTSNGSIAIGSTSISTTAQSNGSTVLSPVLEIKGTNSGAVNATGAIRLQRQDGTAGAFIYSSGDDGGLNLRTVDANGITFRNSSGSALGFWRNGGGLTFNGDTAAANALDDYEEGTWTPQLEYFSGGSWYAVSYTSAPVFTTGYYVKIGNVVHFRYYTSDMTINSGVGANARFSGLPYNAASTGSGYGGAYFYYTSAFSAAGTTGYIGINADHIYPTINGSLNSPNWASGNVRLMVAGTYQTT